MQNGNKNKINYNKFLKVQEMEKSINILKVYKHAKWPQKLY